MPSIAKLTILAALAGVACARSSAARRVHGAILPRIPRGRPSGRPAAFLQPARCCALAIPGNSFAEVVTIDGTLNFLQIYNAVITARILLSWFPQAQSVGFLQPIFVVSDPYLNLFRGLGLNFAGIDFSVLPAFFLLSAAQNGVAALGAPLPARMRKGTQRAANALARRARSLPRPAAHPLEFMRRTGAWTRPKMHAVNEAARAATYGPAYGEQA